MNNTYASIFSTTLYGPGPRSIAVFILGNLKTYKAVFDTLRTANREDAAHVLEALWVCDDISAM